jgi:hypothetical protein
MANRAATLAVSTLVVTGVAVAGYVAAWDLLKPSEARELAPTFRQLLTTPPIDALQPASRARSTQPAEWLANDGDARLLLALRYMHDCTRDGDHIFVTGSTPYQVGYYTQRPIAGGHLEWHQGWLSDPVHERQSLMLLRRQRCRSRSRPTTPCSKISARTRTFADIFRNTTCPSRGPEVCCSSIADDTRLAVSVRSTFHAFAKSLAPSGVPSWRSSRAAA